MNRRLKLQLELDAIVRERAVRYRRRWFTDEHFDFLRRSGRRMHEIRDELARLKETDEHER